VPEPAPSTPAAPSASAAQPPLAKVEPAPTAPAPSADSGTLETYRMDLMRMARNYKRYPRVAMDNNWEGRVVIRMIIGANGMIASLSVLTTSGHEILDKQALDMIQKAKPRVQIPVALRGKEFPIDIPVIYSLKDPDAG
jgi:protein TonB